MQQLIYMAVYLFPTYDAPHYKYGYQILTMFGVLSVVGGLILQWQQRHDKYEGSSLSKWLY
jgi:ACS family pantothenate transporter-like MFS transporter